MEGLAELEKLTINSCEELMNLWSDNMGSLPQLPFLYDLCIYNCSKLVSLVAEEVDQEHHQLGMPSTITSICIGNCIALESLPKAMMYNNTCLELIEITKCDLLTHFARSQLPRTLKRLDISDCKSMQNLVKDDDDDTNNSTTCCNGMITSLLEVLNIYNCPSLESLTSSGELPTTLQRININNCPKLKSVAKSFDHNLFLTRIIIFNCENLQLLNGGGLLLPSNLRELYISDCEKMQALLNGIYNLTSLQDMKIQNCLSILSFPKEGFPTNLTTLGISHLKITEALFDWGQDNLTFLNQLEIGRCQHLASFPDMALPASLTSLHISDLSNLEFLSYEG
ncbi:putative disease resistance protein At3g14460 [Juglans microcarpa x Juglans regia]|uniref:putative disease resistance protein At3g14460 n=1 Tax=Juglans microcarpa x Juglans regia TaxID=2249226 RepID=UPI001B7DD31D|nr:putative disease resistance protein At3g14460 [Juglans microcarpa x Juglans regia]